MSGLLCLYPLNIAAQAVASVATFHDASPHRVEMVTVQPDVKLEVLDWGGVGKPVVLLAGLGNTAHVFDDFAPELAKRYHVYGITRRGFGDSSSPSAGYEVGQLSKDDLAVFDALKIAKPVVIGHSIGGQELSWLAANAPDRISGLVYLDAAYTYALYDASVEDFSVDLPKLQKELDALKATPMNAKLLDTVLQADLPRFERELRTQKEAAELVPKVSNAPSVADRASVAAFRAHFALQIGGTPPEAEIYQTFNVTAGGIVSGPRGDGSVRDKIMAGGAQFTKITVPVLAIFVAPHSYASMDTDPELRRRINAIDLKKGQAQIKAFQQAVPQARVVVWPTFHYVFFARKADTLREVESFADGLQ